MRIAALDDDAILLGLISAALSDNGHVCHRYTNGASLLRDMRQETFDLLIVEGNLPDMPGTEVVRSIRQVASLQLPILFVTRQQEERDVIEAFACGVDDFMGKPVRMGELMARIHALLRRAYPQAMAGVLEFGPYRFDADNRVLQLNGRPIELKNREYELALFMFRSAGRLLSRTHLREAVWGEVSEAPSRSLDTHVSRLRSKLNLTADNGYSITAVYGVGYRLDTVELFSSKPGTVDSGG